MKLIQKGALALLVAGCLSIYSCGPTDDKGGMDEKNSSGEGAIDTTRLPNFDSSSISENSDSNRLK